MLMNLVRRVIAPGGDVAPHGHGEIGGQVHGRQALHSRQAARTVSKAGNGIGFCSPQQVARAGGDTTLDNCESSAGTRRDIIDAIDAKRSAEFAELPEEEQSYEQSIHSQVGS